MSATVVATGWPRSSAIRTSARGAQQTGFGAGFRRSVAVVLAVAAVVCWFGKPAASPVSPSKSAPPTAARVADGAALAEHSPTARPVGSEAVTGPSGAAYYARAIESIRTGQRVLARNPELAGGELPDAAVDPSTWVNVRLRMPKPTGDFLEITLLRPVEWLAEHLAQATAVDGAYPQALVEARGTDSAQVVTEVTSVIPTVDLPDLSPGIIEPITGDSSTASPWIFLTLHELEAVGPAEIVEVGPCPELEPGEGRLVTGTFSHQSGEVFDITIDGLTEPIGCTGAHPFWSEDRHEFIPARDLRLGETLRTESSTLRQITRITPRRGPPAPVFNLEVDAEHVYYVSVDGALVHNAYQRNSNIQANKAAGDLARDLIASREASEFIEQTFTTIGGVRRIDVLKVGDELIGIESKVGRTSLDSRVRKEHARDWWLRRQGKLDQVVWEFSVSGVTGQGGPTRQLLEKLQKLGFEVRINMK